MDNVCTKHANEIEQVGYIIPKYRVKDREHLCSSIKLYHVILKCKAEMDQLIDGMKTFGLLSEICRNESIFKPLFVASKHKCLSAG